MSSHTPDWAVWRSLIRPGDVLLALALLALLPALFAWCWSGDSATRVRIYQDGRLFAELDLQAARVLAVPGPLGTTSVEVAAGRVRIASDPSPRQYCVHAGWLSRAGQSAICLPNRTSIELIGKDGPAYDSLSY
ncbi:NusG domain II-containing protein [Chitinilyticum litopenaei]|uniref:NusG domain II-containing protein n=1 Tax=Chitinilyticum litopenaei TaxID=1121276 RepID=UPI0004062688|nr:NusG domain II-containing protein [Chitinilyticum litopenaei]